MKPAMKIRPATRSDLSAIAHLIRELAVYEKLADQCSITNSDLEKHMFSDQPLIHCLIAEAEDEGQLVAAGFALFFFNFSTFLGKPGLYLEDLFVLPKFRGKGIGQALFRDLAAQARARDCGRMEWSVLDWNEPAIGFYKSLGAEPLSEWTVFRLTADKFNRLAQQTTE